MANPGIIDLYKSALKTYFPPGRAWEQSVNSDTLLGKLIASIAVEFARVHERVADFLNELDPTRTFEMLDRWEQMLGLPDDVTPPNLLQSVNDRRTRVLQKLTTPGGQNEAFYKLLAKQLGYDIDLIDVIDFRDFRVGISRVGEALTNSTAPNGDVTAAGWAYHFRVSVPAALTRRFRVGQSTVGERLVLVENEVLKNLMEKYKPAHTTVSFSFT